MAKIGSLIGMAAVAVGGYWLYQRIRAMRGNEPQAPAPMSPVGSGSPSSPQGEWSPPSVTPAPTPIPTPAPRPTPRPRPCTADAHTVAFLKRQLEDNRERARYYENQMQQIREMPLCSTGRGNVLGCVSSDQERQRLLDITRRQIDYFAGLAEANLATLKKAGCA